MRFNHMELTFRIGSLTQEFVRKLSSSIPPHSDGLRWTPRWSGGPCRLLFPTGTVRPSWPSDRP